MQSRIRKVPLVSNSVIARVTKPCSRSEISFRDLTKARRFWPKKLLSGMVYSEALSYCCVSTGKES